MSISIIIGLLASIAAMLVAIGMLTTIVPLYAASLGFDAVTVGWIASIYYLGFLAGPWITPPLVARLGAKPAFAFGAAIALASVTALPLLAQPLLWAPLRFASGTGFSILYILVEAGLNRAVENSHRGRLLSIYLIASKSALIGGQLLVGLVGVAGALPFCLAAAMIALAAVLHSVSRSEAPASLSRLRPLVILRAAPLPLAGCFLYGLGEAAFFALGPLFAREAGFAVAEVSSFMSVFLLGGALAQWPLGLLSDRIDRRRALLAGALGTIAAGLALGLIAAPPFALALAGAWLIGAFMLPLYALWVALANDTADVGDRLEVSSGLIFAYAVGAVIGPSVAALMMEWDARALPLFESLVYAALALVLVVSLRAQPGPRAEPLGGS